MNKFTLGFLLFFLLFSCSKQENRRCFKNRGKEVQIDLVLENFEELTLGRGIQFNLIQDTANFVVIKTGENLVKFIDVKNSNAQLNIQNLNRCSFFRYKSNNVKIDIHFVSLRKIYFEGSEPLKNESNIDLDYLSLVINESSAEVDLILSVDTIQINNPYAWPQLTLKGNCSIMQCEFDGDILFDFSNFQILNEFKLSSRSSQYSTINLENTNKFIGQLQGTGDVGFSGSPQQIFIQELSTGIFVQL